jgi:hypothetical protein
MAIVTIRTLKCYGLYDFHNVINFKDIYHTRTSSPKTSMNFEVRETDTHTEDILKS